MRRVELGTGLGLCINTISNTADDTACILLSVFCSFLWLTGVSIGARLDSCVWSLQEAYLRFCVDKSTQQQHLHARDLLSLPLASHTRLVRVVAACAVGFGCRPCRPQHAGHTSEGATPEEQASLLADDSTGINYSNGHLALHPAPSLEAAPGSAAALQRVLNRRNKSARTTVQHAASGALLSAVGGAATDYKPSTVAPAAEADGSLGLGMVAGNSRRGRDSGDGGVSGSTVHASHPQPTITAGGIQSASPSHTATTGPAACTQADSRPGSTSGSSSASDGEGVGIRADGKGGKKAGSAKQAPRSALSALSGIARYMGSTTMRHGARHPRAQKDTEALSA